MSHGHGHGLSPAQATSASGRHAIGILLQQAPKSIDITGVNAALNAHPGVHESHDLHVWTLASGMEVASAHLVTDSDTDPQPCLQRHKPRRHRGRAHHPDRGLRRRFHGTARHAGHRPPLRLRASEGPPSALRIRWG